MCVDPHRTELEAVTGIALDSGPGVNGIILAFFGVGVPPGGTNAIVDTALLKPADRNFILRDQMEKIHFVPARCSVHLVGFQNEGDFTIANPVELGAFRSERN